MQEKSLMFYMIRSELEDAVGVENVSTKEIERAVYSVDYFWLSRKWQDAGEQGPMPDIIVRPGTTEEVSKVMKIANYYKIPVTTWGGGSGSQGGALPVAGGILLDIKRLDKLIELNTEAGYVTCETGMIFATLEDLVNEKGYSVMHLPSCMTCCTVGGALAQKSRLCMVGGLRDAVMLGDFHLLYGFAAIFVVTLVGNLAMNRFNLGFALQPIAHSAHVWNLLGMVLVGWGSVLLGGCPLRQLILAGSGNADSAVTVFGMIVGAAFAHNFGLAGNADAMNEAKEIVVGGLSNNGKAAVCLGILIMLGVSLWNMPKAVSAPVEAAK